MRFAPFLAVLFFFTTFTSLASAQIPGIFPQVTPVQELVAPKPDPDRATPQKSMRFFINAMHDISEGDDGGVQDSLECFDLTFLPEVLRQEQGREFSAKLYYVINRLRPIVWASIPNVPDGELYTYFSGPAGVIELENREGNWVFTHKTLTNLDRLYATYEGRPILAGLRESKRIEPFILKLREHIPETLKGRTFLFEDWQWVALVAMLFVVPIVFFLIRSASRNVAQVMLRRYKDFDFLHKESPLHRSVERFAYGLAMLLAVHGVQQILTVIDLSIDASSTLYVALGLLKVGLFIYTLFALSDLISHAFGKTVNDQTIGTAEVLVPLTRRLLKISATIWGIFYAAYLIDFNLTGLIAGLGIGALAVALAAKDTLENLFGSVVVFLDRPFRLGDSIKLENLEGSVEHIGLRSIRLRTPENSIVTLPNAKLISSSVENMGARQFFRFRTLLGIEYDTPPERVTEFTEAVRTLVLQNEAIRDDGIEVHLFNLGVSSLEILVNVYFKARDYHSHLVDREKFLLDLMRCAASLQVKFAFPTQTLFMQRTVKTNVEPTA